MVITVISFVFGIIIFNKTEKTFIDTVYMSEVILKVENVSKQYRLGYVGTGTIRHDLNRCWHQLRGKEDPYLK